MSAVQHIIDTMVPISGSILRFIYYNFVYTLSFLSISVSIYSPYSSLRASGQKINLLPHLPRKSSVYLLIPARFNFLLGVCVYVCVCFFSFSHTLYFVVLVSGATANTCHNSSLL